MDSVRRQCDDLMQASVTRNRLLNDVLHDVSDLVRQIDDLQTTIDTNAFVMVLIDGNYMMFLNELVQREASGGVEAAELLSGAVSDHLSHDEHPGHHLKIVIRVYADVGGLGEAYVSDDILQTASAFTRFVQGFNKARQSCDFVDIGDHEEAVEIKLRDNISLNVRNRHCKEIVLGLSADISYASFLSASFVDANNPTRLRILKNQPVPSEFRDALPDCRWIECKNVFQNELLLLEPAISDIEHKSQTPKELPLLKGVKAAANDNVEVEKPTGWSEASGQRPSKKELGTDRNLSVAEITAALIDCTYDHLGFFSSYTLTSRPSDEQLSKSWAWTRAARIRAFLRVGARA